METLAAALARTSLNFWPPKYSWALPSESVSEVMFRKSSEARVSLSAGKAPPSTRTPTPSALWQAYSANLYAASALASSSVLMTASEEPPFSELVSEPSRVGIWAMRHLPSPSGAPESRLYGIQAPVSREAMEPSFRPRFHSSVQPAVLVSMRSSSMSFCQKSMKDWTLSSPVRLILTEVPSSPVSNGVAPASQVIESKKPASPESEVM